MDALVLSAVSPVPVPYVRVPAWAWSVVLMSALVMCLLSLDTGALLGRFAHIVHEFVHDGRHAAGSPCH